MPFLEHVQVVYGQLHDDSMATVVVLQAGNTIFWTETFDRWPAAMRLAQAPPALHAIERADEKARE